MLLAIGTPEEQWRDAGVEVHLGRVTAQELHDFGAQVIREATAAIHDWYESRDRVQTEQIRGLRDELDRQTETVRELNRQIESLRAQRA